jgi:pyruvate/2-oxoglutarate dehydrogenase complex dihydrolipoamide acyltransferase (E2) component
VRDPYKQHRFVENELQALLQAAGGTLPVIKRDEARGVYVMVETEVGDHGHAAKPAPAKAAAPAAAPKAAAPAAAKPAAAAAPKSAGHKLGENPNRQLFKRSTYAGVKDTGPVPGETFEQKVARLKAVSAGAKQRAEEGGEVSAADVTEVLTSLAPDQEAAPPAAAPAPPPAPAASSAPAHKPTGNADRSMMKRSIYCGVVDTGPVPGETFQQKIARLTALSAAAKQRSEGG